MKNIKTISIKCDTKDFLELAEAGTKYEFNTSDMYTIPGETIMGARFEEHYIDENALYDMIIEIFYEEVE